MSKSQTPENKTSATPKHATDAMNSKFLGKPHAGWAPVIIAGKYFASGSYLDDVPNMCLDACIQYLSSDNALPFGITLDGEGFSFGLVEIAQSVYSFTDSTITGAIELTDLTVNCLPKEFVKKLAAQLCEDILKCIDDWAAFAVFEDQEETYEKAVAENKRVLLTKVQRLKTLLEKEEECTNN